MSIYYQDDSVTLYAGDCIEVMRTLPDNSVDSVVTDPPYDLTAGKKGGSGAASVNLESPHGRSRISTANGGFMGKDWDATGIAFEPATWAECLRVLKPGGHLIAFGGSRTWHRLASAVEDAGFEIRDSIAWLYGSGFPKSLDVSKAIDKAAGAERTERVKPKAGHESFVGRDNVKALRESGALSGEGGFSRPWMHDPEKVEASHWEYAPATDDAKQREGWGTALKPAFEPIVVGRKPLIGTVAANVLEHGTGALDIDGCRVNTDENRSRPPRTPNALYGNGSGTNTTDSKSHPAGRWPTNVLLDGSQAAELDKQSVATRSRIGKPRGAASGDGWGMTATGSEYDDEGGPSRYFPTFRYSAKAPGSQRPSADGVSHPTVKPLDLMRWLVRLVTPPNGVVLEPFAGSGTTAEACIHEHKRCIAVERESTYLPLIVARLAKPMQVGFDFDEQEGSA